MGSSSSENQQRTDFHCHGAEFVPWVGWRSLDACKGKYVSLQSHLEFCLCGSSDLEKPNREEGLEEEREESADCVSTVFKGGALTALCLFLLEWLV